MGASSEDELWQTKARAIFDACDDDGDGVISHKDLETSLRRLVGKHAGARACFAVADKNGNGVLEFDEFAAAALKGSDGTDGTSSSSSYMVEHGIPDFVSKMLAEVDQARPADPYPWMMQYLAKYRPQQVVEAGQATTTGSKSKGGKGVRVNISAVLRKTPKKLLDEVLGREGWEAVENPADTKCRIYFTWDSKAFLARLGHPDQKKAATPGEAVPQLPDDATVNRLPGMGHVCDKVNMALALRLLQKLWPEKFKFWPKSWLLPAEMETLKIWLTKKAEETVIVKPSDGSLGEGIFLVQSSADLEAKLVAKPHWGANFSALAQRYVPKPLLIGGLKFDLRLYCVVKSLDPLDAYLCKEGLARFCTKQYEAPTAANANEHYMHLTNFSVNKKSAGFVRATDPNDADTTASKRTLGVLMRQIEAQEAAAGRVFDEQLFMKKCEEVVAILLQAIAPVLQVTYSRVAKTCQPKPKAKPKAKAKGRAKAKDDSDEEEEDEEEEDSDAADSFQPQCWQLIGVDVLIDEKMQPYLLEINGRPSMDIEEPVPMELAPKGKKRCPCRDMDGEEHVHLPSAVDVHVKSMAMLGAFDIVLNQPTPDSYIKVNFDKFGGGASEDLQGTMGLIARLYQIAGGKDKAFTTSGVRKACAGAVKAGLSAHDLDTAVHRWKHQGYRQTGDLEQDTADIGVLDFAELLQEVATLRRSTEDDDSPLDALVSLLEDCEPDD
eukprot:TRINITY_DN112679_c0_g1_i1.p1 TRINITY_DN112679_c0_g1~~TRINITY_DN112679_c0_g1_i1.p1  ORF type:complete len:737 (+),score=189.07 TRINITY_DN112679_c0_g1_i1:50-2212(+)